MVCVAKTDGERWKELYGRMHVLLQQVQPPFSWEPALPKDADYTDTLVAWRAVENTHLAAIHAAAHELAATGRLRSRTAEVHYFLCYRILEVMEELRGTFACSDEQPVSIVPFPSLDLEEVAEWYLTTWSDYHTSSQVIREEDFDDSSC